MTRSCFMFILLFFNHVTFITVQISLWVFSTSVYGKSRASKINVRLQMELTGLSRPCKQIHLWKVSGLIWDELFCLAKGIWRNVCAEPLREKPGSRERQLKIRRNWFLGTRLVYGFCMSAKRAVYLLRGIYLTLGIKLVSLSYNNVTDSTFLSGAKGGAHTSAPMCWLVEGEERAGLWLLIFHILQKRHI